MQNKKTVKNYVIASMLIFLFASCDNEEETPNVNESLTKHEWEQISGIVDNMNYGSKQFYKLEFKDDYTYKIVMTYGGRIADSPDEILLDTLYGTYSIENDVLTFHGAHGPIGTSPDGGMKVFINSWRIKALSANLFSTEPDTNYAPPEEPAFIIGINPYSFRPLPH